MCLLFIYIKRYMGFLIEEIFRCPVFVFCGFSEAFMLARGLLFRL